MPRKSFIAPLDPWEREKLKNLHDTNVKNARSRIDLKPPKILASTYLKLDRIKEDFVASRRIFKGNIKLLTNIIFAKKKYDLTAKNSKCKPAKSDYLLRDAQRIEKIERENQKMGRRLLKVKSSLNTRRGLDESKSKRSVAGRKSISQVTLHEYKDMLSTYEPSLMERLLRPRIYLDLYLKDIRPLGRVVIQLYTEACPEFVLEFVRMCAHGNLAMLKFIRIFPTLWIEGELAVANHVLSSPGFPYNMHCLSHGQGAGILSFAKCYLNGFPAGLLSFSISLKALPVLKGERVPFGEVCQGLKVLDCLQDYGTKNGKRKKDIVVVQCGVLR